MGAADRIADTILRLGDIQGNALNRTGDIQARAQELAAQARAQGVQQSADALARATAANGQVIGGTLANLGQLPGQVMQQQRLQKTSDLENTQRQQQIDATTQASQGQARANAVVAALPKNSDGTFDPTTLQQQLSEKNVPLAQQEGLLKSIDSVNGVITGFNKAKTEHIADLANAILSAHGTDDPVTADAVHLGLATAQQAGLASPTEVAAVANALQNGADPKTVLTQFRNMGSKFSVPAKFAPLPENSAGIVNEGTGAITSTGMPHVFKNETELASDAQDMTSPTQAQSAAALAKLKPEPKPTAEQDDARYRAIQAAMVQRQQVSADDLAWAKGYEKQKTLGPEATAAAANDRLASTQTQQNEIQRQNQAFQRQQAASKEYLDNVSKPYQTALQATQTLRDTVKEAEGGNKIAANLQALQTTAADLKSFGLNRINTVELGLPANAGSIIDRAKGAINMALSGQPVPPGLQKDMLAFADILDKASTAKYAKSRKGLLDTYDGVKLPDESAGGSSKTVKMKAPNGQVSDVPADQVEHFKSLGAVVQ